MNALRKVRDVLSETLTRFSKERVGTMAAALAYFAFFSIAPMIIVAIAVAGLFFGQEAARGALSQQMEGLVGHVTTLLFTLIFKLLPDVKVAWRHVWQGVVLTAMLFTVGKTILGWARRASCLRTARPLHSPRSCSGCTTLR